MDYRFQTSITGQPEARLSMGHEVLGHWLNDELATDLDLLQRLLASIAQHRNHPAWSYQLTGREYHLQLSGTDAEISAGNGFCEEDIPEDLELYDMEAYASCGLEDFEAVLVDWKAFVEEQISRGEIRLPEAV